ncbi:MAG TPA: radical SAM protein [Ramlibacter sp.]|nr:radical SAM protein [Ramlibacter sp.]
MQLRLHPHTSELTDASGEPLLRDIEPYAFEAVEPVSPANPGWKSRRVHTLKIQLGMACNYSCSYCNQASHVSDASLTRTAQADDFLAALPDWLEGAPERIEFWGGEPLLYFAKLQRLAPALRERFPAAVLSMVTNGSLLDAETIAFIERWDVHVAVSHDGPGQHLRGPDPFDDPQRAHWLRALWQLRGTAARQRVSFNVVLTPANADIAATRAWLAERVGDPALVLDTEGVVSVYDDTTLQGAGRWSPDDYDTLRRSIVNGFETGEALRYISIQAKARDFIHALQRRRPLSALGQKCGMDEADRLAVDLQGQVMTCQNTGAKGAHHLGNVRQMDEVQLNTATHLRGRECCNHCPVVQLCKGSCMYLEGEHFAQSCENEYHYNGAILEGVIRSVTGLRLERITGDIRRPASRRRIPIAPAAPPAHGKGGCLP